LSDSPVDVPADVPAFALKSDASSSPPVVPEETADRTPAVSRPRAAHASPHAERAAHDALTGLANRALFEDLVQRALSRARRRRALCGVLVIEFPDLAATESEDVLVGAARRLEACVRPADVVGRLAARQFAILLDGIKDASDATRVAERSREELGTLAPAGRPHTLSVGIALSTGSERPEELVRDGETAMLRARSSGATGYEVFDRAIGQKVMARLQLESDLRLALERDEWIVHYQPIVSLVSERVAGFEALLRWRRPTGGLLGPPDFLSTAEESGLIVPIGYRALRQAAAQVRAWQERFPSDPPLSLSVNVSARQLREPGLVDGVGEILAQTGLRPSSLRLEVTETALRGDDGAAEVLSRLRSLGLHLDLDDFGTGYCSLGCLHRFPIDAFKVDQSFVRLMDRSGEHAGVVRTILALARTLNAGIVAEGVETPRQLARLRALHCEKAQGHCFSEALEPAAAEALIPRALPWGPQGGHAVSHRRVRGGGHRRSASA
jgi:diguanylate cyclase (GGDEF)-like protein